MIEQLGLIKPKEVTIKSYLDGEQEHTFVVSRYPASSALKYIGEVAEILKAAVQGGDSQAGNLQSIGMELAQKFCGVRSPTEGFVRMDSPLKVDVYIPDGETFFQLLREVHDHNTNFTNSARILETFQAHTQSILRRNMPTSTQSSQSSKKTGKQHSGS